MSRNESFLNDIPFGFYCYTVKEIINNEGYEISVKTRLCPYYHFLENGNACGLLGIQETRNDSDLMDQVKICGENEYDNEIQPFRFLELIPGGKL